MRSLRSLRRSLPPSSSSSSPPTRRLLSHSRPLLYAASAALEILPAYASSSSSPAPRRRCSGRSHRGLVGAVELLDGDVSRQFVQEYRRQHMEGEEMRYSRNPGVNNWQRRLLSDQTRAAAVASVLAPDELIDTHCAFIKAGSDVITTFTRDLGVDNEESILDMCQGITSELDVLVEEAVACALVARDVCGRRGVRVALEMPAQGRHGLGLGDAPLSGEDAAALREAYEALAEKMEPYVDIFLCGAARSAEENRVAAACAARTGKPVWVSLSHATGGGAAGGGGSGGGGFVAAVDSMEAAVAKAGLDFSAEGGGGGGGGGVDGWLLRGDADVLTRNVPDLVAAAHTAGGRVGASVNFVARDDHDYHDDHGSVSSSVSGVGVGAGDSERRRDDGAFEAFRDSVVELRRDGAEIIGGGAGVMAEDIRALHTMRLDHELEVRGVAGVGGMEGSKPRA